MLRQHKKVRLYTSFLLYIDCLPWARWSETRSQPPPNPSSILCTEVNKGNEERGDKWPFVLFVACQPSWVMSRTTERSSQSDSETLDPCPISVSVTLMPPTAPLTIKQLHDATGALVRSAAASRRPVPVTDRGEEVAVIAHRSLLRPQSRKRTLLPEYEAMMALPPRDDIQSALDEIRGDR